MGIYIANMRKPNDCIFCNMYNGEWYDEELGIEFDCMVKNDQADPCPLIEIDIVRCGECKHRPIKEDINNADYGFNLIGPNDGDELCPCLVEDGWYSWMPQDNFFCAYGERRTDD